MQIINFSYLISFFDFYSINDVPMTKTYATAYSMQSLGLTVFLTKHHVIVNVIAMVHVRKKMHWRID